MIFKSLSMFSEAAIINHENLWEYTHSYELTTAQGIILIHINKSS